MFKKITATAAFLALGLTTSFGYSAVAQQTPNTQSPSNTVNPQQNKPGSIPETQPSSPHQPMSQPRMSNQGTSNQRSTTNQTANRRLSAADRQFMINAAESGMAEVQLSQLALQRAATQEVRDYAQRMITAHTQANNQLMQIAQQYGVTLPTQLNARHQALNARLRQIPGVRFDNVYMQEQAKDHNMVLAMFQRQAQSAQNPDLRAFASSNLPEITQHTQLARSLRGDIARGDFTRTNTNNRSNQTTPGTDNNTNDRSNQTTPGTNNNTNNRLNQTTPGTQNNVNTQTNTPTEDQNNTGR